MDNFLWITFYLGITISKKYFQKMFLRPGLVNNHRHLRKIDWLMACITCLVCLIHTVSGRSKKAQIALRCGTSNGYIAKLEQSRFSLDIYVNNRYYNWRAHIRHQCRKTTVLSCHRCLINTDVKKETTFKYRLELWPPDVSKKE